MPAEGGVQPGGRGVPGILENMACSSHLQPPGVAHTTPGHPAWGSRIEGAEGAGNLICGPQMSLQAAICPHERPESPLQDQTGVTSAVG